MIDKNELASAALNAACLSIQNALGITTGDTAGIFFSGKTEEDIHSIFLQYIELELQDIESSQDFETIGYEVWDTGGGCQAYVKVLDDGRNVVVTDDNGNLPRAGDQVIVGIYPDDEWQPDDGLMGEFSNYAEAIAFIKQQINPWMQHCPGYISAIHIDPKAFGFTVDMTKAGDASPSFCSENRRWRMTLSWDNPNLTLDARSVFYEIDYIEPETAAAQLLFCGSEIETKGFLSNPFWNLTDIDPSFMDRLEQFDRIEIQGVRNFNEEGDPTGTACEPDNDNPQFFSVYLHLKEGGVECVADFGHLWMAQKFAIKLGVKQGWAVNDHTVGKSQKLDFELHDAPCTLFSPAYRFMLPDGEHYAYISDVEGDGVLQYPEIEVVRIGVYTKDGDDILFLDLAGRIGLNLWYEQTVGYQPDEDAGPYPLTELIKQVTEMAFRHKTGYDK